MNALHSKYQNQGLVVIGICASAGRAELDPFVKKNQVVYPVALDIRNQMIEAYKVDGYHDYYFIDRFGCLRVADCDGEKLEEIAIALLSEKQMKE